jgi:AcrR family transcriptional regulator
VHRPAAQTREHILTVAHELFYLHGVRASGIDRVAAVAGVAPTTLYRLFRSKDELVAAYVERVDADARAGVARAVAAADSVRSRILATFEQLTEPTRSEPCRGCPLVLALGEFPDPGLPAHAGAVAHKEWVRRHLTELAAGLPDPAAVADRVVLVIEGTNAAGQTLGPDGPVRQGRALVGVILDAAGCPPDGVAADGDAADGVAPAGAGAAAAEMAGVG